jgi:hypothetical protein
MFSEGLQRVCADHKYAFIGFAESDTIYFWAPCHVVLLPDTFYSYKEAFIISKISLTNGSSTGGEIIKWSQSGT